MRQLESIAVRVASADTPVLIDGERGVGKETVAFAIHRLSERSGGPWIRLDCAALPSEVLEAELFGTEGTSSGGGHPGRIGKLEAADRGTLLLKEIRDLPPELQLRLMRALRSGEYFRAGGKELARANVRLIATIRQVAGNQRQWAEVLEELAEELAAIRITVPPLRQRREEIPQLVDEFRRRFAEQFRRTAEALSPATANLLIQYQWPGNINELANVVKRYVVLGDEALMANEIRARMQAATAVSPAGGRGSSEAGLREIAQRAAQEAERAAIEHVLTAVQWNRAEAARRLKISYKTMLNKLKQDSPADNRRRRSTGGRRRTGM